MSKTTEFLDAGPDTLVEYVEYDNYVTFIMLNFYVSSFFTQVITSQTKF